MKAFLMLLLLVGGSAYAGKCEDDAAVGVCDTDCKWCHGKTRGPGPLGDAVRCTPVECANCKAKACPVNPDGGAPKSTVAEMGRARLVSLRSCSYACGSIPPSQACFDCCEDLEPTCVPKCASPASTDCIVCLHRRRLRLFYCQHDAPPPDDACAGLVAS